MCSKKKQEALKHVRIVKNAQYSFVQFAADHEQTAEERAAWASTSVHCTDSAAGMQS